MVRSTAFAVLMLSSALAAPLAAQQRPVLLRDSFPIGNSEGILCQVQDRSVGNPVRQSPFDRRWAVVCRDSALPVAQVYAFRNLAGDPAQQVVADRREAIECSTGTCRVVGTDLAWTTRVEQRGAITWVADGFAAYDSATALALRSVIDNAIASGTIDVASTSVADPLAFARVQAETLKPDQALAEGYRRNLGGEYAEAAAYFETLQQRLEGDEESGINPGEFLVNRALQKSNLGEIAEADRLFVEARGKTAGDPVAERLQRNFEAIHLLNQGQNEAALARLAQGLSGTLVGAEELEGRLAINRPLSARLNGDAAGALGFVDELRLSPEERAEIIDAQALQLRGTAQRMSGDFAGARVALLDAYNRATAVRNGRVTSITRLRAQVLGELATIAEAQGNPALAETYLRNGLAILQAQYPERRAVSAMEARLGELMLRSGREAEGLALYRGVVQRSVGTRNAATGFANRLSPYFRLLAGRVDSDPAAAQDFFKASQILVRPGVAETQAVLARQLSARSDDGARLFRQSIDLGRDIERARIRYETAARAEQGAGSQAAMLELAGLVEVLEQQQQRMQVRLNDFPEYRVVAPRALELDEFRAVLGPGEAYAKFVLVGSDIFMFWVDSRGPRAWRVEMDERDLDFEVDMLRASISLFESGQFVTYPYDIAAAHRLFAQLFAPVAADLGAVSHLVFEPDGALLRLPVDILVADADSVARYNARVAAGGDEYDFTGTAWLGGDRQISTAVSAQSFVDARKAATSRASHEYLGLGTNEPIGAEPPPQARAVIAGGSNRCGWNAGIWNQPIDDAELRAARDLIGDAGSQVITRAGFTDTAITARTDLDQFRVLHFATHGLVTPPEPGCPARPALLTSFGADGSDGLLSFEEIFDLNLDADIVILSACDTAGEASIEVTRAAGVGSGGGTSLDGLVRAFIGAGGRAVMASHWPAPDDYNATERLISQMFREGRAASIGDALGRSRVQLMNDPLTSHPYYWGGFSLIGDAARPLLRQNEAARTAS
ncbi:MAG: CHAT domain-containing protein, partial [Sphingomonadaceae bacterium]